MPSKNLLWVIVAALAVIPSACTQEDKDSQGSEAAFAPPIWSLPPKSTSATPPPPPVAVNPPPAVPDEVRGTIAQYAAIITGGSLPVDGYGLVAGLGKNGSSECPPAAEAYLIDYLKKNKMGSYVHGTRKVTPEMIIRDLDTAVVVVRGEIPPGAVEGDRFDVTVTCPPQTQTRTLDGGVLMPTDMLRAMGAVPLIAAGRTGTKIQARCGGMVFLNPFLDVTKPNEQAKCRTARVIGGGVVLESRTLLLQLYQPDHGQVRRLVDRIKFRFPNDKMAIARGVDNQLIELKVPPEYRGDVDHFTQLVMHLPLVSNAASIDRMVQDTAKMLEGPTQRHEDLAFVLEAVGRQAQDVTRTLYTSQNPAVSFFAARSGLRMGDTVAVDTVLKFAQSPSIYQIRAIEELGKQKNVLRAGPVLRKLLNDENNLVRLAAYEALRQRHDPAIESAMIDGDEFAIDLVPSNDFMIYARQTGQPRIAIFGKSMPIKRPVFYNGPDDMLTINAAKDDKQLLMFRKAPLTNQFSSNFYCDFEVADMVTTLGKAPDVDADKKIQGMGMTYGQIVGTLYRMCKDGSIPAKFVLQELPDMQRITNSTPGAGRPDLSE